MQKERVCKRWAALMGGIMILLACPFLIANQLAAQTDQSKTQPAAQTDQPEPQPDIKFKQKVYDFGTIQQGEKAVHIFRFKNEGQARLKIEKVKTSCGCTVPKTYTKEAPPGGEGHVEVIFDSKRFLGSIRKTIYVNSNDPDEPVVNLSMRGTVIADVVVLPPRPLSFGSIQQGQSPTKHIMVKQGGSHELKILKVEADLPFITTRVIPEPKSNRKSYKVEVTVTPDAPEGIFQGTIKIHTNIKKYSLIEHKVNGIVRSKTAKPQRRRSSPPTTKPSPPTR